MNSSRAVILILGAMALLAGIVIVWQASMIHTLRSEQAAMRQDLRAALDAAFYKTPAHSSMNDLELIRMRHEARALRESLVEARAAQPTGIKGLIHSLLPAGSPPSMQLRPEWKGMEQNASNQYAAAMTAVTNRTNELIRFLYMHKAAKMSLAFGRTDDARRFAEDAIILDDKYSRGDPEKANGDVAHDANVVLGCIAAQEGRLEEAKRHLLSAGQTKGSPVLGSFGPTMMLAQTLLERGEQQTVLQYFQLCRKFWRYDDTLNKWEKDVEEGRIPVFGANLLY